MSIDYLAQDIRSALQRIAEALERIADVMEQETTDEQVEEEK